MTNNDNLNKYDDVFTSILENEKSILGFLSTIFNFLARRTDFYYVPNGPNSDMGFPPGVAEELVLKVLRKCDPKNWKVDMEKNSDINNEIMCSTVAQEVEVVAEEDEENTEDSLKGDICVQDSKTMFPEDYKPPVIISQNSESYNGAVRAKYTWSQTIMDLDVIIKLPPDIKSSKGLKVTVNPGDICVACRNNDIIVKDFLPYKIKAIDSFWSISEGRLLLHLDATNSDPKNLRIKEEEERPNTEYPKFGYALGRSTEYLANECSTKDVLSRATGYDLYLYEKLQERWWNKLLKEEEELDLSKIDCSRPLDELPEDSIAKVRELQWNQEQKLRGLPTSDEIRNIEILKKAWNAEGSPFKGKEFDPNIFKK